MSHQKYSHSAVTYVHVKNPKKAISQEAHIAASSSSKFYPLLKEVSPAILSLMTRWLFSLGHQWKS